jgi:enamine deaminase RidA (YjgF/YER057c/UK114 family)
MSIERLHCGPRMSQVVIHNQTVYLAGQVAAHAEGKSVAEQTREILAAVDSLLTEARTDKSKLLSATIWLTDMATFDDMNNVWEQWIVPRIGTRPRNRPLPPARRLRLPDRDRADRRSRLRDSSARTSSTG